MRTPDQIAEKSESSIKSQGMIPPWGMIRCDNGPEYICEELKRWAKQEGITLGYIQPGNPQQNAYIERFNRTVHYDWLGHYLFESLNDLQEFATNWQWVYNHERPNMALDGYMPKLRLAQAA